MEEFFGLKCYGFEPQKKVRYFIRKHLRDLKREAPSGAFIDLTLTKAGDGYEGRLTINSRVGRFSAHDQGKDESMVVQRLLKSVRREISGWKRYRFLPAVSKNFGDQSVQDRSA